MTTSSIKTKFHQLIEEVDNQELLNYFYEALLSQVNDKSKSLWTDLTEKQQGEVLKSYEESLNKENLLGHENVKKQFEKWITK
jgi:hypothetical protein